MKSRTSFFNPTVFRKNLTRFAPVWIAYSIILLLVMSSIVGLRNEYSRCLNAADTINYMAWANLIYAFVLGQLLFGDLFNSRLCNALHAMPLKRDCWYVTNLLSALVMSLIPNLAVTLIAAPFLGSGWIIAVYWLAASFLQFVFFLGTAAVSAMLVGNRFAMLAVYVLMNFLSLLFYWFFATLYEPLMYGIQFTGDEGFILLSPCTQMSEFHYMVKILSLSGEQAATYTDGPVIMYDTGGRDEVFSISAGTGWGYHAICALIGVGLLLLGLQLYRKRKLETAGDFIAYRAVEPVFLVLFTLGVGGVFQLCAEIFGMDMQLVFLTVGIIVGYYAGRMLMKRTTRVFQPRALIGLAAICAAMAVSLVLVKVDAFGIVRYVPELSEVESVTLGNYYYFNANTRLHEITDPEEIEAVQAIHRDALENPATGDSYNTSLHLTYTLTDGTTVERYYDEVRTDSYAGQALKPYYSDPAYVLGMEESEYEQVANAVTYFWYDNTNVLRGDEIANYDMLGLIEAIAADCEAGAMEQDIAYHLGEYRRGYVELEFQTGPDRHDYLSVTVYETSVNTLRWLEDNGFEIVQGGRIGG